MTFELNQNIFLVARAEQWTTDSHPRAVLAQRDDRVSISLKDGGTRWVDLGRIQTIRRWHHSWPAPDHGRFESPVNEWGACTIHNEINEDLFPDRCVYEFQNGKYLRYDRSHWFDNYGSLGTLAICHCRWTELWGNTTEITANEFADIWQLSGLPDDDVAGFYRQIPVGLAEMKPWMRTPIHIG